MGLAIAVVTSMQCATTYRNHVYGTGGDLVSADGRSLALPGVLAIQSDNKTGQNRADTLLIAVTAAGFGRHLRVTTFGEGRFGGQTRERGGLDSGEGGDVQLDVHVPRGATLFVANMGTPPLIEIPSVLWFGWIQDRTVAAISPRQTRPMFFTLVENEEVVPTPLGMGDRTMHLYTIRSVSGHRTLWRHIFHDGVGEPERVTSEALATLHADPLSPIATPWVGEYGVRAVLGWLESTPAGSVAALALVEGAAVTFIRSDPVPNLIPFPQQRLGLWKGGRHGGHEIELAGVLETTTAAPEYTRMTFHYDPDQERPHLSVSIVPYDFPAGHIRACATDYDKKFLFSAECTALALDTEGNLVEFEPARRADRRRTVDRGLPPKSPLPFVVSDFYFVADFAGGGDVKMWHWTEPR